MLKKIAIVLVVLGVLGVDGGVRAPETLGEKIEESIEGEYARTAFWGVYAQDLDAGRLLYSRNEEKTLIPASNQKLLTTATALDVLGSAYRWTLGLPVSDPTAFTLHLFERYLREAGIDVAAPVYDIDDLDEKPTYETATPLFVHTSPPLAEIVSVINKESNNLYAEQVFHTFGWGGASAGGGARVIETLARLGIPVKGLSVRDGSGLSRKDLVTPAAMGMLLARMVEHDESEVFLASLAEGGERGTTLQFRLRDLPIKGKTGSLEYVRALSGYTTTPDDRTLAFVVMANNYTAPSYRIEKAIDRIVETLATTQVG